MPRSDAVSDELPEPATGIAAGAVGTAAVAGPQVSAAMAAKAPTVMASLRVFILLPFDRSMRDAVLILSRRE
ncbi:hypothetical protein GCM10011591_17200 [Nocardia camponoti]|uniref:Uncharacterized protein n=1 Tax=Nocardia camponoti TaxID=1616106 RepID=A0A917V7D7_9NOCA|nr:hypothetical protein GCM10011591_17200 [Nocardia camponoti]